MVSYVVRLCYFHRFTGNAQIRAAEATRCTTLFYRRTQGTRSAAGAAVVGGSGGPRRALLCCPEKSRRLKLFLQISSQISDSIIYIG